MTANDKIKTPVMVLNFAEKSINADEVNNYGRKLKKVNMLELIKRIEVVRAKDLKTLKIRY